MKKKLTLFLLSLIMGISTALAQVQSVQGLVTSGEDNEPIIGASVLVVGTTIGGITDVDGRFKLTGVPTGAKVLRVSYVGMETQDVTIKPNLSIVLKSDSQTLDEVVITVAYGTAKKSSITGAISTVNSEQIEKRPVSNVAAALEGSTPGIRVTGAYGSPGSSPTVRIRGIGTVNGSDTPLYVIDGVPFVGNISDLNPTDIESMSVLKDAASAALYGNRAANGVILITTKKGKSGKINMNLSISQGSYSRGIPEYKRATPNEFMEISWQNMRNAQLDALVAKDAEHKNSSWSAKRDEASKYTNENLISDALYLNIYNKGDKELFDSNGKLVSDAAILSGYADDLDWFKAGLRNGYRQEYNLSAGGSSEKATYYFSLGYLDEQGFVKNNGFNRISARANVDFKPVKWLKAGLNISGTHQNLDNTSGVGDGGSSYVNLFMYARGIAPIYPVHLHYQDGDSRGNKGDYILDKNGNQQYDGGSYVDDNNQTFSTRNQYTGRHAIWEGLLDRDKTVRNTMNSTAFSDIYLPYDFTFTLKGTFFMRNTANATYNNATIGDGQGNKGRSARTDYRYKSYTFQQQLNWKHYFGNHYVDVLLGHENYSYNYDYLYAYKTTEVFEGKGFFTNFTNTTSLSGYESNYRTESYLGRIRYNYNDKYNAEVSFRRDGSSRFYKENRWGSFGSIGANWLISQEEFMQPVKWVNTLKFRANWGQVGDDSGVGYYGYKMLYTASQNANKGAYYLSQLEANNLKWETGESWGVALESRLFNRWNLSVEYFDKRNKDLLFDINLPLSAGATSSNPAESVQTQNIGTISNRGVEITTDVDIFANKDWKVNFATDVTFLKNKILSLPEQNRENGIIDGTKKIVEGRSRYDFWLYSYVGVDQMTGNALYKIKWDDAYIKLPDGEIIGNEEGTNITDYSTNINGEYYTNRTTAALKEFHGTSIPAVTGSFSANIDYRNFSLSALFTYSLGGQIYDGVYRSYMSTGTTPNAYHTDLLTQSWKEMPEGMTADSPDRIWYGGIPQINSTQSEYNNAGNSSRWLVSGDYLVLKNVSLSYQLPRSFVKRTLGLEAISVNTTCENLFSLTARRGMNPQMSVAGTQSNYIVIPRVFTVGVNIKL
ncbi:MAG: SusC/RagA family TonB-linked outer membrane protein [Mediterranea sp.]|jgi:TonB-linked SusC/RagA family outer membrane protein|nr:SusC/RagA family TonB-linked outer membrane protein [Mediterranea sp.]